MNKLRILCLIFTTTFITNCSLSNYFSKEKSYEYKSNDQKSEFQQQETKTEVQKDIDWKEFSSSKFRYKIDCFSSGSLDEAPKQISDLAHFDIVSQVLCVSDENILILNVYDWKKSEDVSVIKSKFINAQRRLGQMDKKLVHDQDINVDGSEGLELIFIGDKDKTQDTIENFSAVQLMETPKLNYIKKRILFDQFRIYELEFRGFSRSDKTAENLDDNNKNISERFFNSLKLSK